MQNLLCPKNLAKKKIKLIFSEMRFSHIANSYLHCYTQTIPKWDTNLLMKKVYDVVGFTCLV